MARLFHGFTQLAVNVVPAAGWFAENWSAGTTLAVYWFETLAGCLLIAVRIAAHRRLSPRRGHFRYSAPSETRKGVRRSSFLGGFLVASLAFGAAHGIFLAAILFLLNRNGEGALAAVDWHSVATGCAVVLVFLVVDLVADLPRLRRWSFLRIEQIAQRGMGRIVVVHLTLIFGLMAVGLTDAPSALFGVFVVLKTMYSLSLVLPQYEPATPPQWFSRLMNRVPNAHPGERFEDYWAKDRVAEADRRERNDQPWTQRR
jgi:hypothetical protein